MRSFEGYGEDTAKYLQYEPANEEDGTQLLDMKSDLKESSSAQRASLASFRNEDLPCIINKMPAEIIITIVRELTPCMRVCLGVTCKFMYQYFKYVNPKLVDLSEKAGSGFQNKPLHMLLNTWIGPQYRHGVFIPHHFLLKSVYGQSYKLPAGEKEFDLAKRYIDHLESIKQDKTGSIYPFVLPNPCNKGDSWNEEALEVMREDLKSRIHDVNPWFHCWFHFHVFCSGKHGYYEHLLEWRRAWIPEMVWSNYSEWREMIGF
ncbi:uncharacterized protein EAE98_003010 [Botrytis deweyae]|uniref:F-box domain-containing protein n=2 Tax=Botrytis TaxID=33196 RepID=A0A4Z1J463_9HELO|nr:uncharacterized protein EAE98_003010 [Botrytis deweyae]KAF7918556.1 hypothetical protein EAE99_008751 [Botrytis elliptica]KAF7934965.1 hypothetical protein EAE98_003010 [Botrytis deweyae]TGO68505.1 hypothetical protein BELL_0826g00040 [Botrytis elliptica]